MASAANPIAASNQASPARAIPSLSIVEATRQADLPTWARTSEARQLLAAIRLQRPHITVHDDGLSAWNGRQYSGRNAAQLRNLFDLTFDDMLQHSRLDRDDLVAWRKVNNADAVISKLLGESSL